MDEFLDGLRAQGQTDSSGQFTLDVRKAMEKLQQYQFPKKHLYVLSLVASAVAGGATFLDLDGHTGGFTLSYDGLPLSLDELRDLYGSLFARQSEDRLHLRELAIGMHAAGRAHTERAVTSWDEERQQGVHMRMLPERLELQPQGENPFKTQIVNRLAVGSRSLTVQSMTMGHPEFEFAAVQEFCRHSGITLRLDGEVLTEPREGLTVVLEPRQPTPGMGPSSPHNSIVHLHDGPYRGILTIPETTDGGTAMWVVNGLTFNSLPQEVELREFGQLLLYAPHLPKDLSQTQLIVGEQRQELGKAALAECWRALATLGEQRHRLAPAWSERVTSFLLQLLVKHRLERMGRDSLPPSGHFPWLPLWNTPWLDSAYGGTVSLAQLHEQMREPGGLRHVPLADSLFPVRNPRFQVLLETPLMRAPLRQLFTKLLYEWMGSDADDLLAPLD